MQRWTVACALDMQTSALLIKSERNEQSTSLQQLEKVLKEELIAVCSRYLLSRIGDIAIDIEKETLVIARHLIKGIFMQNAKRHS